ncbi:GNAT family N-acetyltransferase [Devosia sp.]|uniref:GNAT family N-acetyltransferase n=1 Tax=Devosia sp. TaxID=1871048 RepID=UPI003A95B42A
MKDNDRTSTRVVGTEAQARQIADAAARLAARRQRDALPHRINTPRLVLRAPIRGDVPDLVALANNKAIAAKLSRLPSPYTRADGVAFVEIFAQRADQRPYAITLGDRMIGVVGLTLSSDEPAELGYWLGEPYWGKGYMSEAVKALLTAAFETKLFPELQARALADNAGSLRVLEKSGFVRTGEEIEGVGTHAGKALVLLRAEPPRWL